MKFVVPFLTVVWVSSLTQGQLQVSQRVLEEHVFKGASKHWLRYAEKLLESVLKKEIKKIGQSLFSFMSFLKLGKTFESVMQAMYDTPFNFTRPLGKGSASDIFALPIDPTQI